MKRVFVMIDFLVSMVALLFSEPESCLRKKRGRRDETK